MWTDENGGFRKRLRHRVGSSLARARDKTGEINMADRRIAFVSLLLGLLASIMACFQSHFAMLNVQGDYARRRRNIIRLLSLPVSKTGGIKRLNRNRGRQARPRRFWVRPGRTSAWWDNFVDQIVISEEWRENFRMSRGSVYKLAEELRPFIEDGTVFSQCCVFVCTGKNDSKTQRVDAEFF